MVRYNSFRPRSSRPSGPTKATIMKSNISGWWEIVTPWNQDFLDSFKSVVASSYRFWDKDNKVWRVRESVLDDVVNLLKLYFDQVVAMETDDSKPEAISTDIFGELFKTLKDLPNNNMDKVYLALSNAVHPDKGGTNTLMTELNRAYQENK